MAGRMGTGEVRAAEAVSKSAQALSRACHDIVDAASALLVNVEFLAQGAEGDKQRAAADSRYSIERIIALAEVLRGGAAKSGSPHARKG